MRIKEIELINFRQHRAKKVALAGNLIGIVGPNGSGKSNFLRGIQFGLVGDVPDITKDKLLTWGANEGYVELLLENDVRIRRFTSSTTADLVNVDKKTSGTIHVNAAVKMLYGLDKDLAKQAVFVRQAEIDSILFETPAKREQAFQKLCGTGMASTIHKKAGETILNKFKEPPNYDEQIALTTQRITDDGGRLTTLLKEQEDNKLPVTEQELTAMKLSLNEYVVLLTDVQAAMNLTKELEQIKVAIDKVKIDLNHSKVDTDTIDLTKITENIDEARQLQVDVVNYKEAKATFENRQQDLEDCGTPSVSEEEVKNLTAKHDDLLKKYYEAQAKYAMLSDLYSAIFKVGIVDSCPVCDSVISDPAKVNKNLQTKMATQKAISKPDDLAKEVGEKTSALSMYRNNYARASTLFEQADKTLKGMKPLDIDTVLLTKEIATMVQTLKTAHEKLAALKEFQVRLNINEDVFRTKSDQFNKIIAKIDINSFAQECKTKSLDELQVCVGHKHIEISAYIDAVNKLAQENSHRNGVIGELTSVVTELEKTLADLLKKREGLKNFTQVTKTLTSVRDWFHYSNGPRTLSTTIIKDMSVNINDLLDKLEAPFSVIPQTDEGLSFQCIFHDGRTNGQISTAEDLSGGEKIILATSFRLAAYCMFSSQLGLLSLDEPTVYLDDKNVAHFCTFLEKVKEVASVMNLQILMATHERSVIPHMDTVIDLGD